MEENKIEKMNYINHAEICPVCKGEGILIKHYCYTPTTSQTSTSYSCTCHGCDGKGWITVRDNYTTIKE